MGLSFCSHDIFDIESHIESDIESDIKSFIVRIRKMFPRAILIDFQKLNQGFSPFLT